VCDFINGYNATVIVYGQTGIASNHEIKLSKMKAPVTLIIDSKESELFLSFYRQLLERDAIRGGRRMWQIRSNAVNWPLFLSLSPHLSSLLFSSLSLLVSYNISLSLNLSLFFSQDPGRPTRCSVKMNSISLGTYCAYVIKFFLTAFSEIKIHDSAILTDFQDCVTIKTFNAEIDVCFTTLHQPHID
jgi:hypothetical protein